MSKILCFMDFEYTTSGDKKIDFQKDKIEILSIGAIFVDSKTRKVINQFYELVKPKKNYILSDYCINLTNISQAEVNKSRSLIEVVSDFIETVNRYKSIEFYVWGGFDHIALKKSIRISEYNGKFKKIVHKLKNIQPMISKSIKYNGEVLSTELGLQKVKLIYNMEESENKHNALYDAIDLKDVYYAFKNREPKNKVLIREMYDKNLLERKRVIENGLRKHSEDIQQLWNELNIGNKCKRMNVKTVEFKKLVSNMPIEYRGIDSVSYHQKTISILRSFRTNRNTVGKRVIGTPLAKSIQYSYSNLKVEVYPKSKKDKEMNIDIPMIEIRVYNGDDKLYLMFIEIKKSTKKSVINFITETFLT